MDAVPKTQRSERAQTSPLGIALIVGITLIAAIGIVVFGTAALEDSQRESQLGQAEQTLTQFDARTAQVALGDSDGQTVRLGRGGNYRIDSDAGHVTIKHYNRSGNEEYEDIYDGPLGAVVYEHGETEIVYQGGGVWRKDAGGATMVSPPELHYRRATLTFPIIRVTGDSSASGDISARISKTTGPRPIFANASDSYENGDPFVNPVAEGQMEVTIESDYCEGWQSYLESRTEGEVSECDEGAVSADLLTLGAQGEFPIDEGAEPVELRGVGDDQPLEEFDLTFKTDQNPGFTPATEWYMGGTDEDGNTLQIGFRVGGPDCGDPVKAGIYYNDGSAPDSYASWVISESDSDAFEVECREDEEVVEIDLLDGSRDITYRDVEHYDFTGFETTGDFAGTETVDGESHEPGDSEQLDVVVQHYFEQIGDMTVEFDVKPSGNPAINDDSFANLHYEGDGRVVTFLHITENEVEVRLR